MKIKNILTFAVVTLFAAPAIAVNPYTQPDDTWISIDGKVASVSADEFVLDYGDGMITVEMDDGDRDADAYKLLKGDKVRVYGAIDDDFFEFTKIEAASVYVKNIDTYFYASAIDEEDFGYFVISPILTDTVIRGTITSINADEEEFTLDTGLQQLTVEVDELLYNPLDNEGYQKLEVGDLVSVDGKVDNDLFEGRVFEADYVTTIIDVSVMSGKEAHKGAKHPAHKMGDYVTSKDYDKEKSVSEEYKENLEKAEHSKGTRHPAHDMGEGEEMLDKRGDL